MRIKLKSLLTAIAMVLSLAATPITVSAQSENAAMIYDENDIEIARFENDYSESYLATNARNGEDECPHTILYTFNNITMTIDDVYEENTVSTLLDDISYYSDSHSAVILKDGTEVLDGYLEEGMIVQVYHNKQLYGEYTVGKLLKPSNTTLMSTNSAGYIKPLDDLDTSQHFTCGFNCEANGKFCDWCVKYGYTDPIRSNPHNGQDIFWPGIDGTTIRAMIDGTVVTKVNTTSKVGYGSYVEIDHGNGLKTVYAHMQYNSPNVNKNQIISAGTAIGKVGDTGYSKGVHLHLTLLKNGIPIDPVPSLKAASTYVATTKTYKIIDGPLTIRANPSTLSTSYGTLANGTSVPISNIKIGDGTYVFGLISSGTNTGRWIAIGTTTGEIYAANMSDRWYVFDGPLNVRETASTSATSYGTIVNGSSFFLSDVALDRNYIMGKIALSPTPSIVTGSTCTVANAKGHWVAINYCAPYIT